MSYFDLKRFSRVCKRFHQLEQNPHLDSRLCRRGCTGFKQRPRVHECRKGQRVRFHPVLHLTWLSRPDLQEAEILVFSTTGKTATEAEGADDDGSSEASDADDGVRNYHPLDLPVGAEYATSPPCSQLVFVAGWNPVIADSRGVKVRSVIEAVTSMWASPASEEAKMMALDSRGDPADFAPEGVDPKEVNAASEKMWNEIDEMSMWDTLGDCTFWAGMRSARCIEDGKVALQPNEFD
ncbi:hypothetical protein Rhopal_005985-T1 [Rhodotorula paludigena]|uniref:F-box domain-containing protein n=1 Tax=Rhodotorula paludigena TaxID=86838 RepID=A0AAV5GJX3_9BASI|nr:hypothetical protein Rhopal_005985-T1 [Rhodotorula paludigena]